MLIFFHLNFTATLKHWLIQWMTKKPAEIIKLYKNGKFCWPARVPDAPARFSPFFFKMKLEPINALDATAKIKPIELSGSPILVHLPLSHTLLFFLPSSITHKIRNSNSLPRSLSNHTNLPQWLGVWIPAKRKNFWILIYFPLPNTQNSKNTTGPTNDSCFAFSATPRFVSRLALSS